MKNSQENIIHKLIVDIQTSSINKANYFKNNIEAFLQEEVFTKIEKRLDTFQFSEDTIIQIPKMELHIDIQSREDSSIDIVDKEEIKNQIVTQLIQQLKEPEKFDLVVKTKSKEKLQVDSFFHFLEKGTISWRNNSEESLVFSKEILFEITGASNFEYRLLKALQNPNQKKRLIQQFLNDELQIIFLGIQNKSEEFVKILSEVSNRNFTSISEKQKAWYSIVEGILNPSVSQIVVESKEEIFFQFLADGVISKAIDFSEEFLQEVIQSTTFEKQFIVAIQKVRSRNRLIHQFSNVELQLLFSSLKSISKSDKVKLFEVLNGKYSSIKEKQTAWSSVIENIFNTSISEISSKSSEEIFFQFLADGIVPETMNFSENFIREVTKSSVFEKQFTVAIQKTSSRNRLINQFSNSELQLLISSLKSIPKSDKVKLVEVLNKSYVTTKEKQNAWSSVVQNIFNSSISEVSSESKEEVFFQFLKEGIDPITINFSQNFIEELIKSPSFKNQFIEVIQNDNERKRLINQFSNKELLLLFDFIEKDSELQSKLFTKLKRIISSYPKEKQMIWSNVIEGNVKNELEEKIEILLKDKINLEKSSTTDLKEEQKGLPEENSNEIQEKTTYLVNNVGLILLHPFLKQFFKTCGFLNEKNEIIKLTEAVHTLHYIATKKEKQLESNLVFEKFLCGIPISKSIERDIEISEEVKENVEELLKAVLQNWEILKNSSTDLLRNEFLQRSGKLDLTNDNPYIIVERKTQDILLEKVPWSLGICKLPWMDNFIEVSW